MGQYRAKTGNCEKCIYISTGVHIGLVLIWQMGKHRTTHHDVCV